jgi:hypothetical protein
VVVRRNWIGVLERWEQALSIESVINHINTTTLTSIHIIGHFSTPPRPMRTRSGVLESSHRALSIYCSNSLIQSKFENRSNSVGG